MATDARRIARSGWSDVRWSVAVASPADVAAVSPGDDWLSAEERAACGRLVSVAARADYRASRLAARRAVAALGAAPAALSLSHRLGRGAAAATASRDVRVGVDLEAAASIAPECARYFLTRAERRAAERGDDGGLELAALWALKEAAWKALDVRDTVCFSALELAFDDAPRAVPAVPIVRAVVLNGRSREASADVSTPWPGFVLAVVRVADTKEAR